MHGEPGHPGGSPASCSWSAAQFWNCSASCTICSAGEQSSGTLMPSPVRPGPWIQAQTVPVPRSSWASSRMSGRLIPLAARSRSSGAAALRITARSLPVSGRGWSRSSRERWMPQTPPRLPSPAERPARLPGQPPAPRDHHCARGRSRHRCCPGASGGGAGSSEPGAGSSGREAEATHASLGPSQPRHPGVTAPPKRTRRARPRTGARRHPGPPPRAQSAHWPAGSWRPGPVVHGAAWRCTSRP